MELSELPKCIHCDSEPYWSRSKFDTDGEKYFALSCPNDDCIGHETTSADTFPWCSQEQAISEWIEFNIKDCPLCHGNVCIIKHEPKLGRVASKYLFCDSCTWRFSPSFIMSDANLVVQWNKLRSASE